MKWKSLSHIWLLATPWTVACQAPLFMVFSRQECWSGLLFPTAGDLPHPGIEPVSLVSHALTGESFTTATWEALFDNSYSKTAVRWYLVVVLISCVSDEGYWASFHVPDGHLYAFFGKMSVQNFCSFKNQIVGFLLLSLYMFFNAFWILAPYQIYD